MFGGILNIRRRCDGRAIKRHHDRLEHPCVHAYPSEVERCTVLLTLGKLSR